MDGRLVRPGAARWRCARPDQTLATGITRHLFEREFAAHSREQRLIEATGEREGAIRNPALAAEQSNRGRQHRIEPPGRFRR